MKTGTVAADSDGRVKALVHNEVCANSGDAYIVRLRKLSRLP